MPAKASPPHTDIMVAAAPVPDDRFPRRPVDFPGGVTGLPDLVYAVVPGFRPMTLDLYLPPADTRRPEAGHPLVVYVHGGAWMSGHARQAGAMADFPGFLASLARRGYAVASVNYRLSGEATFPAALHDVKTAIRWLRSQASSHAIDPRRALVWGSSAGGQLAALVATSCGDPSLDPPGLPADLEGESDCVLGAVTWYGIFDLDSLSGPGAAGRSPGHPSPEARYLGCDPTACDRARLAVASPIDHVDRGDPPMLLIHGMRDRIVPYRQSERMAGALRRAGVSARLVLIPDADHSFIGPTAAATRDATYRAIDDTLAFIDEVLGRGNGAARADRVPSFRQ